MNVEAFGRLVERYQDMVYGAAYALLGDFHDAQDAAQETFVQAWRDLPKLRHENFPGWLCTITRNRCLDVLRRPGRPTRPLEEGPALAEPSEESPDRRLERAEMREAVLEMIGALSEPNRLATTLFYINGYSVDEVAEFLDVPAGTVKRRLHDSRKELKERMVAMVEDTLKGNALPEDFARRTVEEAVARDKELNVEGRYTEAEGVLRTALGTAPEHPGALAELNRALMRGQVYGEGRFDLLPELVEHGRTIVASGRYDEHVARELARTLLAMPAMPEAVEFVQDRIRRKGPNLERLGMLAWARGCVGDHGEAEEIWRDLVERARSASPETIGDAVPQACDALVDCFAAAGQMARAERVALAGWELCRAPGASAAPKNAGTYLWPDILERAGLGDESAAGARAWFEAARAAPTQSAWTTGEALCARAWFDDAKQVTDAWLAWVRERIAAADWQVFREQSVPMALSLIGAGRLDEESDLAEATVALLEGIEGDAAQRLRAHWDHWRFPAHAYVKVGDLDKAEAVARAGVAAGRENCWWWIAEVAVVRGGPSPPRVMEAMEAEGSEAFGGHPTAAWYHVAREAAAAGAEAKAFDAFRRTCRPWTNPPLHFEHWEGDARWGALRQHPEFERILDEKRRRRGPIYGTLKYFPGW